ncbi:MAG: tRNA (guanosine(37)-N1)-methyltransferase TrmD [Acholeplasmataceae bacterium]|nr:tRNA (guanosine(37)-N1)-methyltransferase TrmD [Acholeplasmataceae bacterium]
MKIDIITIFPEFFNPFLETSIIKRAIEQKIVSINAHQLRDYSKNKHKKVDDTPYGGGAGMLMTLQPLDDAITKLREKNSKVILLSPQGKKFTQKKAIKLAKESHIILICGHYEGIDARIENYIDEELSIGDYVLTGGEIPAMIVSDAVIRLVPGVIHEDSSEEDSLQNGWLKYPQYTKPNDYKGHLVPEVLLSGNHQEIMKWREEMRLKNTVLKRSDLLKNIKKSDVQAKKIEEIKSNSKKV